MAVDLAVDLGLAVDLAVDAESTAKTSLAVDMDYKTVGFGGGSQFHCQIHCQTCFGGGRLYLAVDFGIWRWIWRWIYHLAVDLAVDFSFGGGCKIPLPKFSGGDPLGTLWPQHRAFS